ncbi:Carbonyl reductase [NADPH] 1, partial [Melipona quadrifasciata]
VTGGNRGIGFAVVKELCQKFRGTVYLTARDVTRGQNAVKELEEQGLRPKFHQLDVTDEDSIRTFRQYLSGKYMGVDILVNNAGIAFKVSAEEGFYRQAIYTLDVNYFGLREVCKSLYPLLNPHARVVHVSSSCGRLSLIPKESLRTKFSNPNLTESQLDDLLNEFLELKKHSQEGWPNCAYIVSKIGVGALTEIQQRLFDDKHVLQFDIAINSVYPGYVQTNMTDYNGILLPEHAAEVIAYAALLPENTEIKGKRVNLSGSTKKWRYGQSLHLKYNILNIWFKKICFIYIFCMH